MPPNKRPRRLPRWALVLIFLFSTYLAACFFMATSIVTPRRLPVTEPGPWLTRETISGPDGSIVLWRTAGLADPKLAKKHIFIIAHGLGGSPESYFRLAEPLHKYGEVVVVAMRGQTVSPIEKVGFGPGEKRDLIAVAAWAKNALPGKPVTVVGVSMGGAASFMAAGERPDLVDSVVTEGAFARLDWGTDDYMSVALPGGANLFRPTIWMVGLMSGVQPSEVRPLQAAEKRRGMPCLVIHGEAEQVFGRRHPDALVAAGGCSLWVVPGLRHAQLTRTDPVQFSERIWNAVKAKE